VAGSHVEMQSVMLYFRTMAGGHRLAMVSG